MCTKVVMDRRKQAALERLASVEPWELSGEAKTEICRATRDLRSCGRAVRRILTACGHACLCVECRQRCDSCPICRTLITNTVHDKLRLYEQCMDAGLIQEEPDSQSESPDVHRLFSFFDVALDNNLVSLICHYVSEVCMDEGAVSSNALVSILLDGGVVKDWCKRTFHNIALGLRDIYNLGPKQMYTKADAMDWNGRKLEGVVQVLEALEAPLVEQSLSPTLLELQQILESIRKVLQHVEVMAWCVRHQFLEIIPSRYVSITQWRSAVQERKAAAQERVWPEASHNSQLDVSQPASLFIEEALANLGLSEDDEDEGGRTNDLQELSWLRQASGVYTPASLRYRRDAGPVQSSSLYPPDSVRAAVDLLFLEGTSDLILAKKSIFLYYLFDRHWSLSEMSWRGIVDDYVGTFSIARHFMLESLVFYLLDDNSEQALEEACRLLPEISSQNTHPKVASVLLERQKAEAALAVLHASGCDGQAAGPVPLADALTAVRVRLQCDLLTEGYLYQRAHCDGVKREGRDWASEMEVLVGEVCRLCMRMGILDKMLVLPWRKEEEKYLKKCLLEHAGQDPPSKAGSLLVVFYIQRCRYVEAYAIHKRLCDLEEMWMEKCIDGSKLTRVRSTAEQRNRIIEKCMELLPEVHRQQARNCSELEDESPQPATMEAEMHKNMPPLASPLFGHAGRSFARESMPAEEASLPSTSTWADNNQSSFLKGGVALRSPAPPTPILSNLSMPKSNGPTATREFGTPGASPVQGRRLRYEAEPPREPLFPSFDLGEVRGADGVDTAGPASWGGGVEKRVALKVNGTDILGNGSLQTEENGSRKGNFEAEDEEAMEMDFEGMRSWASNGKRHPSDRSWLQKSSPEKETHRVIAQPDVDGADALTSVLPWESTRRGKQTDENGGVRWRSDEGDDDSGPGHSPPTRMKALTPSQGRTRSRFYSGRV